MELALYLSKPDDLLHLEQGLRRLDYWDAPKFIFEIIFGDDTSPLEYLGNLAAAEWLENYLAAGHEFGRLYYGQEFCEYLIPSCDDLEKALSCAREMGLDFTYVTGYVTDAALAVIRRNLAWLVEHAADSEVVVNDWGVLALLAEDFPELTPVLGRLQIKQQRMARYTTTPPPVNLRGIDTPEAEIRTRQYAALQQLNLSIPEYRQRLQSLRVERFDLDIVPQGVDIPPDAWGFGVSCYYPWGYVTGSRNCYTAGVLDPARNYVVTGSPCPAPCRKLEPGGQGPRLPAGHSPAGQLGVHLPHGLRRTILAWGDPGRPGRVRTLDPLVSASSGQTHGPRYTSSSTTASTNRSYSFSSSRS